MSARYKYSLGIDSTLDSTSAFTGSLQVSGGVGIAKQLFVGDANGVRLSAADGAVITKGWDQFTSGKFNGSGRYGLFMEPDFLTLGASNLVNRGVQIVGYNADSTNISWFRLLSNTGVITLSSTIESTATGTGALQVAGGASIAKNAAVGGEVIGYMSTGFGQFRAVNGNFGVMFRNDGSIFYLLSTASGAPLGVWNANRPFQYTMATNGISSDSPWSLSNTTDSISTTSGALQVAGGIAVKNMYIGNNTGSAAMGSAVINILSGSDASGIYGRPPLAFEFRGGGYKHYIVSRHNSAATPDAGNGIDFYLNASNTAGGSSTPGTGNILGLTISAASTTIPLSADSTSTTTGALQVSGGAAFGRTVSIGGNKPGTSIGVLKLLNANNAAADRWWMGFCAGPANSADTNDRARIGIDVITGGAGRIFMTTGASNAQTQRFFLDESGNLTLNSNSLNMGAATIPYGLSSEVGGTTPIIQLDANFRTSGFNTAFVGAAFRIDTRSAAPLFQWISRPANGTETVVASLTNTGNLFLAGTINSTGNISVGTGGASGFGAVLAQDGTHALYLRRNFAGATNGTTLYSFNDIDFYTNGVLSEQTMKMNISAAGVVSVYTATDSASPTSGAFVVAGGAGIAKSLYVGTGIHAVQTHAAATTVNQLVTRFDSNWGMRLVQNYVSSGDIHYQWYNTYNVVERLWLTVRNDTTTLSHPFVSIPNSLTTPAVKTWGVGERYPPAAMTAATTTLTGQTYGNGAYTASASSQFDASWSPWKAFNYIEGDEGWHTTEPLYNASTGMYTGATSTTVGGTAITGEWIQLQLPQAINLKSTAITPRANSSTLVARSPRSFVIAGSNDGTTWTSIFAATGVQDWVSATSKSFSVDSGTTYLYYRLIVREIGNSTTNNNNLSTSVNITEWHLNAYGMLVDVVSTTDSFSSTSGALTVAGGTGIAKNLSVGGTINGASYNKTFQQTTNVATFYKIATLPVSSGGGTYDHIHLIVTLNYNNLSTSNSEVDAVFANRNGFAYFYETRGFLPISTNATVVVYNDAAGQADIYIRLTTGSLSASCTVVRAQNCTVYSTVAGGTTVPTGTIIFDASNPTVYAPNRQTDASGNTATTTLALHDTLSGSEVAMLYPPTGNQILTGINTTLTNLPYGNGLYYINSSSVSTGFQPWQGFQDKSVSNPWSSHLRYNTAGAFTGAGTTQDVVTGISYAGEVIEVQLPAMKYITSVTIYPRLTTPLNAPATFVIMGSSTTNSAFRVVYNQSTATTYTESTGKTLTLTTPGLYNWIRIVAQTIGANAPGGGYAQLSFSLRASTSYVKITNTVEAASATSGALQVSGGIGVAKNIIAGGQVSTIHSLVQSSTADAFANRMTFQKTRSGASVQVGDEMGYVEWSGASTTGLIARGGYFLGSVAAVGSSTVSTNLIFNTTNAAGTAGNRMRISGEGDVSVLNATESTSTTTGALQITGGAGIAKNIQCGGTIQSSLSGDLQIRIVPSVASAARFYLWNRGPFAWYIGQPSGTDSDFVFTYNLGSTVYDFMRINSVGHIRQVGTGPTFHYFGGKNQTTNSWQVGNEASNADGTGSFLVYNNNNTGVYLAWGGTSWLANSDIRLKKDIEPITERKALESICALRPVSYEWKNESNNNGVKKLGLIAQEVQLHIPEVVDTNKDGFLAIGYSDLIPHLIASVKELKKQNDDLRDNNIALEKRLADIESRLNA